MRVEADPGAGAAHPRRSRPASASSRTEALADPTSFARSCFPPETVAGAARRPVKLEPPDALAARRRGDARPLPSRRSGCRSRRRAASLDRARAARRARRRDRARRSAAEPRSRCSSRRSPAQARIRDRRRRPRARAPSRGSRASTASSGPARWPALYPLVEGAARDRAAARGRAARRCSSGTGGPSSCSRTPTRTAGRRFPGFPLTIARIVEAGAAGADSRARRRVRPRCSSPAETHVARGDRAPSRAPAPAESVPAIGPARAVDASPRRCAMHARARRSLGIESRNRVQETPMPILAKTVLLLDRCPTSS